MNLLSIDPSLSSTGYAIIDNETYEILEKGRITTNNKLHTDDRVISIISSLIKVQQKYNVDTIILEDGYVGFSAKTSLQLSELRGAIIAIFKYKNMNVAHRMPSEIRKNFGLQGNAKKEEVADAVLKIYPQLLEEIGPYSDKANKKKTSDIYDAISIGLSYIKESDIKCQEVVEKKKPKKKSKKKIQ